MVNITKVVTKTGDSGDTSLVSLERVRKSNGIISAVGAVDEVNAMIGTITTKDPSVRVILNGIQHELFDLGADLCNPIDNPGLRVKEDYVDRIDQIIAVYINKLKPLRSFVLPTGDIHVARSIARRAELAVWKLIDEDGVSVSPLVPKYLNRLSDLLFVLARYENMGAEVEWMQNNER